MKATKDITENRYSETDVDRLPENYGQPISAEQRAWMESQEKRRRKAASSYAAVPDGQQNIQQTEGKADFRETAALEAEGMEKNRKEKNVRKKGKGLRKTVSFLLVCAVVLFGCAYGGVRYYVSKMNYRPFETEYVSGADVFRENGTLNMLLIGTDERHSGDTERSDSMIILSINQKKHRIVLTSILRDSYVNIPGHGQSRLNAAYQYGGAALLIQTIEENFKIGIDYYAKVDFYSFVDIVDAVGGVDIDVDEGELVYVNGYLNEINALLGAPEGDSYLAGPGVQRLNGKQALSYARIRYIGMDFQRTDRQREIIQGIASRAKTMKPTVLIRLLDQVLPQITTNVEEHKMTMLILKSVLYLRYDMKQNRIPMDGTWSDDRVNGQEVLGIDFDANIRGIRECIYQ